MKKLFLSIGLALSLCGFAQAKTPPEVLKPYKAYRVALKKNDVKAAAKHGLEAWQQAETLIGDAKITGDLALNYAEVFKPKKDKNTLKAFERAIELSKFYGAEEKEIWLDRNIKLAAYQISIKDKYKAGKLLKKTAESAKALGFGNSTYMGEIKTHQARLAVMRGNHKETEKLAGEALSIFSESKDGIVSVQPIFAKLYSGFGNEGQDKSMDAALDYQTVMESIDGKLARDHPLAAQALGRWSHMRSRLHAEGKLEEAEQKGLCQCWPYDKPRNEKLEPIKRVPPRMPAKAYSSGYSIVEFDLDDAGNVINPEVLTSWPREIFEKSTLNAIEKWKYTPRLAAETEEERQDLIVTLRYRLTDSSGNVIY